MKLTRWLIPVLVLALILGLCACGGSGTAVYVQSVAQLANMGGIAPGDRFAGIVVSEDVVEITKDQDKTVEKLLVKAGDDVKAGQELFSYDTQQLQLNLDKQRLEQQQLEASIENYKAQIAELEDEKAKAAASDKLQYTVQIQTAQLDLKEAELNLIAKKNEVTQAEAILANATVVSPVNGRVQAVSENGTDNYGNPLPYITIQQSGSYRIKGIIGELQLGSILEGSRLKITSRTDDSCFWTGTVTLIDYENPSQGNNYDMYYGMSADEMTAASKYPFYIAPDTTEGLVLGQHVYLELDSGEEAPTGVAVSSVFVCYDEDGSAYVWAESRGKLEKRTVTLGEYNMMTDAMQILDGLTEDDYIAFPDPELCVEGAPTTRQQTETEVLQPMPEGEVG